ncbi:hypothetical protein [Nocardia aurantiaca]|uniref:Uncharacterized protein n=1 Tax=Nocardia aurantiaca TaxID=2675850 RepID=A0A6I3KVU2_9NOCA|nr:hypothetical protein [Nocardia aurantiaca]MTE12144.1 hypothetical protein [Nocardia aurantiaca]
MPDGRHLIRNLRERLRVPSGPRSRRRVIALTHPLLDPGIAYWEFDDVVHVLDDEARIDV